MKKALMIVAMVAVIGMAGTAHAIYRTWDGGAGNGLWGSPLNWGPDGVPVAGDEAELIDGAVVSISSPAPSDSRLGMRHAAGTSTLNISADIEWDWGTVGGGDCTANVTQTAGTVFLSRYNDPSLDCFWMPGTDTATGTYEIHDGKLQVYGGAFVGRAAATSSGALTIYGGVVQAERLTIDAYGVVNFGPATTGVMYVNTADKTEADILALIKAGNIVALGGEAFAVTELVAGDYTGHTEVKLGAGGGVVPEPAGLGLIGIALLAVRKRRNA